MMKDKINNLDDMAKYFFQVAKEINHPLQSMQLKLTDTWENQNEP